jgi:glycosyltransferase involved in cell wall biosynthesis
MEERKQFRFDFYLLIPYYNNLPGLIRSVRSVNYDPGKYALLIVDDGSKEALNHTDLTGHIPASLAVKIIHLPENKGITKAMNTGLEWLQESNDFRFVARLDCGDLCAESRFRQQVAFLDQHTDIDLVGSWCTFKDFSTGSSYRYITPTEHEKITRGMHFRNIFIHPTVMWRATVTQKAERYPEDFPYAEDYGFFYEILNNGKAAVIPEDLVTCEINPKGISLYFRKEQLKSRGRVVKRYGKNKVLSLIGIIKLWFLMVIPYGLVLQIKKFVYGIKRISVN